MNTLAPRLLLILALVTALAVPAGAQPGRPEGDPPVKVTLYPAAAPVPAMKHALLPRFLETIEGNAAVYYGKVTAEQARFFNDKETWQNIDHWENEAALEELVSVDFSMVEGSIVHQLELAARCEYCDWQIPVRQEKFYTILLPEVQQTRQFARILATQARIHIAKSEYEEAIADMRRGYALARNVAKGDTLINGLVGIAIEAVISNQLHTMIQQPDAPNLYWALAELPDPLVDIRGGVRVEMNSLELSFPELRDLENADYSPQRWRELLEGFWMETGSLLGFLGNSPKSPGPAGRKLQLAATMLRGYPMAKQALIAQGFDAERVEQMPVAQVVLVYSLRTYRELRDETFKWFYVPYHQSAEGVAAAEAQLQKAVAEGREILPLASMLLPAVNAVRVAETRMKQRFALLRTLEALRMHAAAHEGKLPASLAEIDQVPVPVDPATGKPFDYRLEAETAFLTGAPLQSWQAKYEITIGKP